MNSDFSVLLVERNASDSSRICGMLHDTGLAATRIICHSDVNEILLTSFEEPVGVVLIGIDISGEDGIENLRLINSRFKGIAVIVLTKEMDEPLALAVIREGAQGYLSKEELTSQKLGQTIRFSLERNAHINALKKSYEALRLSEQRFVKLFHNNPAVAMTLSTDDGVFLEVNEVFLDFFELTINDVIGKKSREVDIWINPEQRNGFVRELRQGGVIRNREAKMKSSSGKLRHLLFSMDILETESGTMLLSSGIDISDRVLIERKLKESENNLDTLINSSSDAIWLADKEMRLVKANKTFRDIVGRMGIQYKDGDPLIFPSVHSGLMEQWQKRYARALAGEQFSEESMEMTPSGDKIFVDVSMSPIYDERRQVIGAGCFRRDISQQKHTELKIEAEKERYEKLSKATNDAVWDLDMLANTVTWNHGLETIFGYEKNQIIPTLKWRFENIHPEDYSKVLDRIDRCVADGKTNWSATYRYRCANGDYKFVYDRGYVMYSQGSPLRMTGALQDIDQLMKAVEEIRKLSLVASKTDNLVLISDAENNIEWVNESFIKLMGYSLEEVRGKNPRDFLPGPDTDQSVKARIGKNLLAGKPVSEELINYSKAGKPYWLKLNINPVFDEKGKLTNYISVVTDVTIHKAYEKNITAIAREQSLLIGNANAIIFGVDINGYVNEWNKLAADTTGLSKNDILEKRLLDILIDADHRQNTETLLNEVLMGKPVSRYEFPIMSHSGEQRILLLSATPRRNASGEIVGLLAVGQDITELTEYKQSLEVKVAERTRELEIALQKEKELANLKSRFASMVSHEFRTPLSTIKLSVSYLDKYRSRLSDADIAKKFQTVQQQVAHMTRMLEDILTLGKSGETKIQILKCKVNVSLFLEQIIEEVENTFNGSHKIRLSKPSTCGEIETDDALLRNIFINLLNNAIKFSPHNSEVCIDTRRMTGHILIDIKDKGLGIPVSEVADIFDPFYRGSNVETIQGTGLGLSIVKKAVDLIGGTLRVQSEVGIGSVFTVSIPVS